MALTYTAGSKLAQQLPTQSSLKEIKYEKQKSTDLATEREVKQLPESLQNEIDENGCCRLCGCPLERSLLYHDQSQSTREQLENCEIHNPLWYRALCDAFSPDGSYSKATLTSSSEGKDKPDAESGAFHKP